MERFKKNSVPILFFILAVISFALSGVSEKYLFMEVYTRFTRNALFVLALILPIACGMGINFAITVGAISAQTAIVFVIGLELTGVTSLIAVVVLSVILSIIFGNLVANILNRARGKEMIVSIMIGQLSSVIYQFIFMVGYGLVYIPKNKGMLLNRGIGVRSMLDAKTLKDIMNSIMTFKFDGKVYSFFPIVIIAFFGVMIYLIGKSKLGTLIRAVGEDIDTAEKLGINSKRTRKLSIIISTILAAMSQILSVSNLGTVTVYTGHLGMDTFAAASILVGGATLKKANMKNSFIGIILFHALFVTSPLAGKNLFDNPAVGEYFRSFIVYATIVIALIMNLKNEEKNYKSTIKNLLSKN